MSASSIYWSNPSTPPQIFSLNKGGYQIAVVTQLNTGGEIVGILGNSISMPGVSAYWSSASASPQLLTFGTLGTECRVSGINDSGVMVGFIRDFSDSIVPVYWTNPSSPVQLSLTIGSTIYTEGQANGINSAGTIVGEVNNKPAYWTTPYTSPTSLALFDLTSTPLGTSGLARGINNFNEVVGNIGYDAVYWSSLTDTNPLSIGFSSVPDIRIIPYDINDGGEIVGVSASGTGSNPTAVALYWPSSSQPATPLPLGRFSSATTLSIALSIDNNSFIVGGVQSFSESNICFPAGTPVLTDQGIFPIDKLSTMKHTINGQEIKNITTTVTRDPYLISFEKNSIGRNMPSERTIMTKDHKIEFEGRLVPAYRFLDFSSDVKKVKYSGERLYNVLLAKHGRMRINNMVCETLDPDNVIAKLYSNKYNNDERVELICQMNNSLHNRNLLEYKRVVNRIQMN
jgi:hypothetical protein